MVGNDEGGGKYGELQSGIYQRGESNGQMGNWVRLGPQGQKIYILVLTFAYQS